MVAARYRRVTGVDVARASGVTPATVSYVLNSTPGKRISEETRQRVLEAAQTLGYVINTGAASLSAGRSTLAVLDVSAVTTGPGIEGFIRGYSLELATRGLVTIVYSQESRVAVTLEDLARTTSPFAVTSMSTLTASTMDFLRKVGVEYISDLGAEGRPSLEKTVALGGAVQIDHLVEAGHEHIAYVLPPPSPGEEFATVRLQGAIDRAAVLGIGEIHPVSAPGDVRELARLLRELLSSTPVSAVACYDDATALAVLAALREIQLEVPGDISVMGYSDIPLSPLASPPLTTVREDATDAGVSAARDVLRTTQPGYEPPADTEPWTPEVVVRQSVSPPSVARDRD